MKKNFTKNRIIILFIGFFIIFPFQQSKSQEIKPYIAPTPENFLGIGLGVNNYGFGIGSEVNLTKKFWLYGMAGISTWGYRLTGGVTYYPSQNGFKSSFSLGYSYASGAKDFETDLYVESDFEFIEPKEREVMLDLLPIHTMNLIYSYNVNVGRKSKFVFSAGYALPLIDKIYEEKNAKFSIYHLTEGSKDFIDLMAPGGVIIGVKYMFGST